MLPEQEREQARQVRKALPLPESEQAREQVLKQVQAVALPPWEAKPSPSPHNLSSIFLLLRKPALHNSASHLPRMNVPVRSSTSPLHYPPTTITEQSQ